MSSYPTPPGDPGQRPSGYGEQPYPPTQGQHPYPGYPGGPPPNSSKTPLIIAGTVVLLVLIGAGVFLASGSDDGPSDYAATQPPAAVATPPEGTPANPATAPAASVPTAGSSSRRYADSPDDGFLALRSQPSAQSGSRIVQIPHAASVDVGPCDGPAETVGGRSGRWCQAQYDGRSGYLFDAYLVSSQPAPRAASRSSSGPGGSLPAPGPTEESEAQFQVTGADAISIRTHPSVNAPRVTTVPRNATFTTDVCEINSRREGGRSRTWCHVELVGDGDYSKQGWVSIDNSFVTVIAG